MKKTNAVRRIEAQGVPFRTCEYDVDPSDLAAYSVAEKIRISPSRLLKTLVVQGGRGFYFAVVPTDMTLSLKALAREAEERKLTLVAIKEIEKLTGYVRGGVTVPGAKKTFPVFVHQSAMDHSEISISAGRRGQQVLLDPADYVRLVDGRLCDIAIPAT